jgi:hypothetical protein
MEVKGCLNCSHKKNIDRLHYKCAEKRSQPNINGQFENNKFTGSIKDTKTSIRGNNGHNYYLGCTCIYWNPDHTVKETVSFT